DADVLLVPRDFFMKLFPALLVTGLVVASPASAGDEKPLAGKWRATIESTHDGKTDTKKGAKCFSADELDPDRWAGAMAGASAKGCEIRDRKEGEAKPVGKKGKAETGKPLRFVSFKFECTTARGSPADVSGKATVMYTPTFVGLDITMGGAAKGSVSVN